MDAHDTLNPAKQELADATRRWRSPTLVIGDVERDVVADARPVLRPGSRRHRSSA